MDPFDDLDFSEECPEDCNCPECRDNHECPECGEYYGNHAIGCGMDDSPFALLCREGYD